MLFGVCLSFFVIFIFCCSFVAGNSIPPLVIMKGVIILKRWFTELPPELDNLLVGTLDSGYSNDTLFFQWLQY